MKTVIFSYGAIEEMLLKSLGLEGSDFEIDIPVECDAEGNVEVYVYEKECFS